MEPIAGRVYYHPKSKSFVTFIGRHKNKILDDGIIGYNGFSYYFSNYTVVQHGRAIENIVGVVIDGKFEYYGIVGFKDLEPATGREFVTLQLLSMYGGK